MIGERESLIESRIVWSETCDRSTITTCISYIPEVEGKGLTTQSVQLVNKFPAQLAETVVLVTWCYG